MVQKVLLKAVVAVSSIAQVNVILWGDQDKTARQP
jgi:hypothetical protein